jgi:hypothetical protein
LQVTATLRDDKRGEHLHDPVRSFEAALTLAHRRRARARSPDSICGSGAVTDLVHDTPPAARKTLAASGSSRPDFRS